MNGLNPDQPNRPHRRRRLASGILLFGGTGYFLFCLILFFWWMPLETTIAGFKISLVSLRVPLKISLALIVAGLYLRYYDSPRMGPALVFCGLGVAFFLLPHELGGDGEVRYQGLAQLLEQGRVPDTAYPLIGPLFSSPLYWLGKAFGNPEWWCARYNTLLLGLGLFLSYRLLRARWGAPILQRFFLILLAGSMFPHHLQFYFGEVFTAVWVAVGTLALGAGRPLLGWIAVVAGVVNTPAALPALGLLCLVHCFRKKDLKNLLPLGAAGALILMENVWRRGGFFLTGYEGNAGFATLLPYSGQPGFSYPFLLGVLSILFSFGKGLLWFAPGMFLSLKKWQGGWAESIRQTRRDWLLLVAGLILVYAKWWSWYGGFFWGPRFFLFASFPASLVLAVRLDGRESAFRDDLVTLAALTLSFWVGLSGAVYGQHGLGICRENQYALEYLCWYVPEFSALWRPVLVPLSWAWSQEAIVAYIALVWFHLSRPLGVRMVRLGLGRMDKGW